MRRFERYLVSSLVKNCMSSMLIVTCIVLFLFRNKIEKILTDTNDVFFTLYAIQMLLPDIMVLAIPVGASTASTLVLSRMIFSKEVDALFATGGNNFSILKGLAIFGLINAMLMFGNVWFLKYQANISMSSSLERIRESNLRSLIPAMLLNASNIPNVKFHIGSIGEDSKMINIWLSYKKDTNDADLQSNASTEEVSIAAHTLSILRDDSDNSYISLIQKGIISLVSSENSKSKQSDELQSISIIFDKAYLNINNIIQDSINFGIEEPAHLSRALTESYKKRVADGDVRLRTYLKMHFSIASVLSSIVSPMLCGMIILLVFHSTKTSSVVSMNIYGGLICTTINLIIPYGTLQTLDSLNDINLLWVIYIIPPIMGGAAIAIAMLLNQCNYLSSCNMFDYHQNTDS